jgi:hypothetical protein
MFLFCSHRVKRAVQGIEQAARCLFAAALNESVGGPGWFERLRREAEGGNENNIRRLKPIQGVGSHGSC